MARALALTAAIAASLLAVAGAGGAATQQTPKRGGTVVIANSAHLEPACLNPLVDLCSTGPLDGVLAGAYEVMPDATFRPDLARGEVVSREPFALRYRIRPEARWSDGTPVTAGDFEFTHRAIREYIRRAILERRPVRPEFTGHQDHVRSVRRIDAKTVRVVLQAPNPDWRFLFDMVLPRHALAGHDLLSVWRSTVDNPRTGTPIGSGPFLLDRVDRGRQIVLRRNPRYWGPHPAYLDRIVHRFLAPVDAADALRRGEADMIDTGPPILQPAALEVRGQPGIRVIPHPTTSWEHFEIRMPPTGGHPLLKRKLVRRALAYGIDREAIARAIGALTGVGLKPLDSAVFLASSRYYEPNWKHYRHRPAEARRLLERDGCRRGTDGIYVCHRERLSLRFMTPAVERRIRTIELARDQLRRVGVEVIPQYIPPGRLSDTLERRDFDVALFGFFGAAGTTRQHGIYGCQAVSNFTGFCDRLLTRDLEQAGRILDVDRASGPPEQDRRQAGEGRTGHPALPAHGSLGLRRHDTRRGSERLRPLEHGGLVARRLALIAAFAASLLAVAGAGGAAAPADAEAWRHARRSPTRPPVRPVSTSCSRAAATAASAGSRRFCRNLSRSVPTSRSRRASSRGSTSRGGDRSR